MPIPVALIEQELGAFGDLRTSAGWERVLTLIDERIADLKTSLSKPSQTMQLEHVRQLQGALHSLEWVKGLPERHIKQLVGQTTGSASGEGA